MGLIRHSEGRSDEPVPGVKRVTVVERATGAGALTMRLVTVEPGTNMAPHWHKVEEAMMVLEGEGTAIFGDERLPIKAGETLLGPPGVPHGFINPGPAPMRLVVAFPTLDVETFPAQ